MRISHRKGMTIEEEYGIERAKEIRRKNSEGHEGQTAWNKNIPRTEKTKEKISRSKMGKKYPKMSEAKMGSIPWNKNKPWSQYIKDKISKSLMGQMVGENNPNWRDGISREPYPFNFDDELKELIRKRDNYKCRKCGCPQEENIRQLSIHHIDYDKQNCDPRNLVSLCTVCHSEVNFDRDRWQSFFEGEVIMRDSDMFIPTPSIEDEN